jgi:hypothetical protein
MTSMLCAVGGCQFWRWCNLSNGCGLITMSASLMLLLLLLQAMQALDEKHLVEGSVTPLAVT